tara:strand:- start:3672 stop:4499 length:828 start_codon:yes stop_codon:yes gene_type:complete
MSNYELNTETDITETNILPLPMVPKPPSTEPTKDLSDPSIKDKVEMVTDPAQYYVKATFMLTYILLLTTATVTFTESLRTTVEQNRHMLNLQTCISVVAGYFYSLFLKQINTAEKENKPIEWEEILKTRYIDWGITTPIMLIVLCSVLATILNKKLMFSTMASVIILNYTMLIFGFAGETNNLNRIAASIFGFASFGTMFYIIYKNFMTTLRLDNMVIFGFYFIVWGLYGVMYLLNNTYKNIGYNILDFLAKTVFSLGLWLYYSKLVSVPASVSA